jgi:hypothetical protein
MSADNDRLDGWGEILAHLKLGNYRTAVARGYPVRVFRETGAVFAFKSELLAHETGQPKIAELPPNTSVVPQ